MSDEAVQDPGGFVAGRRRRSVEGMPRCTVVVVGKTGVGKSTLVNAVFGEQLAATGVGEPVTQHFEQFRLPGMPVGVVDSRGIELADDLAKVADELDGEIDRRLRAGPDEHLHVLWYCVGAEGARFEPRTEGALIARVAGRLPTLVVLTKAYDPEDPAVRELVAFIEAQGLDLRGIVPVLAEGRYGLPGHGLDVLIRATERNVDEGVRRALINAQVVEVDAKLRQAMARVDALVEAQDVTYRPLAFMREAIGRKSDDQERFAARVLEVVAEAGAAFGTAAVTDQQVSTVAESLLGDRTGDDGLAELLRWANRILLAIPPLGPTAAARYGGKLLAGLAAALAGNHADRAARIEAQLVSRTFGRAAAKTFADAARAEVQGTPLTDEGVRARFSFHVDDQAAHAAES